ncbi:NAD(P)-dependent oxidoreductase [Pontibacillus sp. ALD_SL1]|uniref:NAD-dependent epimerase/dehydratase family protein n=1 Tax=Pontibacillus sp. ALD_SL1 TaxID=2777185 RepID=UPI001A9592EF|nr:NAD(P)-dependent oxidoreductase [Pontibacillus sp. ALD_SL1]QST01728.1 NAD(P)-dependent oxidoreductase [Pontibacillus sp. ALD_SL1]
MKNIRDLEQKMCEPSAELVRDITLLDGDIMILGVGGKMGPTLAKLAKNAVDSAKLEKQVYAVSRFSKGSLRRDLEAFGVKTIAADLLDEHQLDQLPDVKNIIYMVGHKFGTTGNEHFTWAMNSFLPGLVAKKFKNSRIVSFSTGNVYPLTPVKKGGVSEEYPTGPIGEYAQSCLGRERVFSYYSHKYNIPQLHFRLNYAIDLRYGVLLEIAKSVKEGKPVDVTMGHANVIWQGDANDMAIRSLLYCSSPPEILNVTGPETMSIRWAAEQFGELMNRPPVIIGEEQDTALLSNASKSHKLFGYPRVTLREMIEWTADWLEHNGETLDKPTHFQEREGKY